MCDKLAYKERIRSLYCLPGPDSVTDASQRSTHFWRTDPGDEMALLGRGMYATCLTRRRALYSPDFAKQGLVDARKLFHESRDGPWRPSAITYAVLFLS